MKITVFTPTYNRGYIIETLHQSLLRQSFSDFEWIVVDDGSTDQTEELFERILAEAPPFPVHYEKCKNGGKHRAINRGVSIASGELFFIVDSDDYLTDDALEKIVNVENSILPEQRHVFAGVCGQRGYSGEKAIGSSFEGEQYLDITSLERPQYHITGDKAEVFYTEILRKYPFPEFEGENFLTECVVWNKIAFDGYKLRFFNEIVYICDYLPDGLTSQGNSLFEKNPKGWGTYLYQRGLFGQSYGIHKWEELSRFYHRYKDQLGVKEIARLFHLSPFVLKLRMFGLKVFYKLYDR